MKSWPLLRAMLGSHLPFLVILWVVYIVVVMAITGIVAATGGVSESVLHHASTQAPRWLMFGLGLDVISTFLRLQVAHGRTRREFLGQAVAYAVVTSGFVALLVTLGYPVERAFYAMFDWPQRFDNPGLFSSVTDYGAIFPTFWLVFLLWTVAGLVLGIGFFRGQGVGLLTIPLGVAIVFPSLVAVRNSGLPFLGERLAGLEIGTAATLVGSAVTCAVGVAVFWAMGRDAPLRARTA